jgi:hypothetical protein
VNFSPPFHSRSTVDLLPAIYLTPVPECAATRSA